MNKAVVVAMMLWLGAAGGAGAAGDRLMCPSLTGAQADAARLDRIHEFCEARWSSLVTARHVGRRTHDDYVNTCTRQCAGKLGAVVTGAELAGVAAGVAGAVGVVVAAIPAHGAPASP
jgi:hypothetical protein